MPISAIKHSLERRILVEKRKWEKTLDNIYGFHILLATSSLQFSQDVENVLEVSSITNFKTVFTIFFFFVNNGPRSRGVLQQ